LGLRGVLVLVEYSFWCYGRTQFEGGVIYRFLFSVILILLSFLFSSFSHAALFYEELLKAAEKTQTLVTPQQAKKRSPEKLKLNSPPSSAGKVLAQSAQLAQSEKVRRDAKNKRAVKK